GLATTRAAETDYLPSLINPPRVTVSTTERAQVDHAAGLCPEKRVLAAARRTAPADHLPGVVNRVRRAAASQRAQIAHPLGRRPEKCVTAAGAHHLSGVVDAASRLARNKCRSPHALRVRDLAWHERRRYQNEKNGARSHVMCMRPQCA